MSSVLLLGVAISSSEDFRLGVVYATPRPVVNRMRGSWVMFFSSPVNCHTAIYPEPFPCPGVVHLLRPRAPLLSSSVTFAQPHPLSSFTSPPEPLPQNRPPRTGFPGHHCTTHRYRRHCAPLPHWWVAISRPPVVAHIPTGALTRYFRASDASHKAQPHRTRRPLAPFRRPAPTQCLASPLEDHPHAGVAIIPYWLHLHRQRVHSTSRPRHSHLHAPHSCRPCHPTSRRFIIVFIHCVVPRLPPMP